MTKTEQEMINLLVRRYEAMQSKYKLRKEIAVIKREVAARVASGNVEGLNHSWYSEVVSKEDGSTEIVKPDYSTDELDDLYRDYHGCRHEITNILAAIRYQCKKHIEQNKEK